MVNKGLGFRFLKRAENAFPCGEAFFVRVGADGDAADFEAAEKQRGGIELGHRSGEPANDGDATVHAQNFKNFIECSPADIIDREIDTLLAELP